MNTGYACSLLQASYILILANRNVAFEICLPGPSCHDASTSPRCVAIQAPTDLLLCWLGVPFRFGLVENYADNTGLGVPVTEGYHSRIPGSVDLMKTWLVIIDNFFEDTGITLDIKDARDAEYPIVAFILNRQTCDITMDQHDAIEDMLEDMGVKKKYGPGWYLDRRELVGFCSIILYGKFVADVASSTEL